MIRRFNEYQKDIIAFNLSDLYLRSILLNFNAKYIQSLRGCHKFKLVILLSPNGYRHAEDEEKERYAKNSKQNYLSFSVDSPTSARITAIIQKRITIVGSDQPFFSKW